MLRFEVFMRKVKTAIFRPSVDSKITYAGSLLLQSTMRTFSRRFAYLTRNASPGSKRGVFICDLGVSSCAYDFTVYIASAELYFRESGIRSFDVLFFDESQETLQDDNFTQRQRVLQILMPLADSYHSCDRVDLTSDVDYVRSLCRKDIVIYPQNYDGLFRRRSEAELFSIRRDSRSISGFCAKTYDLALVQEWIREHGLHNRGIVSITIRDRTFDTHRNTDLEMMISFSAYLKGLDISTIYVPDTESKRKELPIEGEICIQASTNIYQRIALYESCGLNIFSHNGPAEICLMNENTSFLIYGDFGKIRPGFDPKEKSEFAKHRGAICYASKSLEDLISEFWCLVKRNDGIRKQLMLE